LVLVSVDNGARGARRAELMSFLVLTNCTPKFFKVES